VDYKKKVSANFWYMRRDKDGMETVLLCYGEAGRVVMKILFVILALAITNVRAADVEIVQSVPLETTLAAPGIRHAQDVWVEMIGAAKSTLDLEQFYVSDKKGEALEPVLRAVEDAARRGVRVRLLADTKFYKNYPESIDHIGKIRNCEARLVDGKVFGGGVQHAKFFIVDGMNSFVGRTERFSAAAYSTPSFSLLTA